MAAFERGKGSSGLSDTASTGRHDELGGEGLTQDASFTTPIASADRDAHGDGPESGPGGGAGGAMKFSNVARAAAAAAAASQHDDPQGARNAAALESTRADGDRAVADARAAAARALEAA